MNNFPQWFIWKSNIPPKIIFFIWCAVHGKLNTADLLLREGISCQKICSLCGNVDETSDHLLLHCKVAYKVWGCLRHLSGPGRSQDQRMILLITGILVFFHPLERKFDP